MAWEWGRQWWGSWTDLTPCPPLWKISKVCFFEILIFSPCTLALQSGNSVLAILGPEKIRLCFCSQLDGLCSFPYKKWGCSHERTYMFKKTPQVILSFFSSRVSGASTVHSLVSVFFFPTPPKAVITLFILSFINQTILVILMMCPHSSATWLQVIIFSIRYIF